MKIEKERSAASINLLKDYIFAYFSEIFSHKKEKARI
jgi:hypothetical protein